MKRQMDQDGSRLTVFRKVASICQYGSYWGFALLQDAYFYILYNSVNNFQSRLMVDVFNSDRRLGLLWWVQNN